MTDFKFTTPVILGVISIFAFIFHQGEDAVTLWFFYGIYKIFFSPDEE